MAVQLRSCIDNFSEGGTCFNTNNVLGSMVCNSVLRVFVETTDLVIMPKKKQTKTTKASK